jgi:hypothetical protein
VTEPTNQDRAEWARLALAVFDAVTTSEDEDCLSEFMHYCRLKEIDFHTELSPAARNFEEDVKEEEEMSAYRASFLSRGE